MDDPESILILDRISQLTLLEYWYSAERNTFPNSSRRLGVAGGVVWPPMKFFWAPNRVDISLRSQSSQFANVGLTYPLPWRHLRLPKSSVGRNWLVMRFSSR